MSVVVWFVVGLALAGLYTWYAAIVRRRNRVSEALSGIDVQLQQRHDLIPTCSSSPGVSWTTRKRFSPKSPIYGPGPASRSANVTSRRSPTSSPPRRSSNRELGDCGRSPRTIRSCAPTDRCSRRSARTVRSRPTSPPPAGTTTPRRPILRNSVETFPGQLLKGVAGVTALPPPFEAVASARAPVDASKDPMSAAGPDPRPPDSDRTAAEREEPPWVQGLVTEGFARSEAGMRGVVQRPGRKAALSLWALTTVGVFFAVLVLSIVQSPNLVGVLRGLGAGAFAALLIAAAIGWTLMWAFGLTPAAAAPDMSAPERDRIDARGSCAS